MLFKFFENDLFSFPKNISKYRICFMADRVLKPALVWFLTRIWPLFIYLSFIADLLYSDFYLCFWVMVEKIRIDLNSIFFFFLMCLKSLF